MKPIESREGALQMLASMCICMGGLVPGSKDNTVRVTVTALRNLGCTTEEIEAAFKSAIELIAQIKDENA